jgi:hypothetical protein
MDACGRSAGGHAALVHDWLVGVWKPRAPNSLIYIYTHLEL